jgi:hypothetical protein
MVEDSVDYKIDPLSLGYTFVGPLAPRCPFNYQQWINTSTSPAVLERRISSAWVAESTLGPSGIIPISPLTSAHIFVGNASNLATDVAVSGDLTLANTGAFTIANNAITTNKIADGAVTAAKISGAVVLGPNSSTVGHIAIWNDTTGSLVSDTNNIVTGATTINAANGTDALAIFAASGFYGFTATGTWTDIIDLSHVASATDAGILMGASATGQATIKWLSGRSLSYPTAGLLLSALDTEDGLTFVPVSGAGRDMLRATGTWTDFLDLSVATATDAAILLGPAETPQAAIKWLTGATLSYPVAGLELTTIDTKDALTFAPLSGSGRDMLRATGTFVNALNCSTGTQTASCVAMGALDGPGGTIQWPGGGMYLAGYSTNGGQFRFVDNTGSTTPLQIDNVSVSTQVPLNLKVFTVATLPACAAGTANFMYIVDDADTPTYNGMLTGSGASRVPVICDGTNWRSI